VIELLGEPLGHAFFLRALLAATLVGSVCAVVGTFVVLKGLAFIGDAVSHAAFPGVVAAYILHGPILVGAGIAAVLTALSIGFVTRRAHIRGDTAIGVLFAGAFALGVFMFSTIQGYVGDLFGFLFGSLLLTGVEDLVALAILAAIVLAIVGLLWKELLYATFDPQGAAASGLRVEALEYLFLALVALTIVVSLQAVGIILVVAMLVTPAATGQLLTVRFGTLVALAVGIGIGSSVMGLYISYWLDVATGATIVLVQTGLFLVALALGPRTGLLSRRRTRPASRPVIAGTDQIAG
jgi:manganese/iron transport system permease protein